MPELKFYARSGLVYDPTRARRTGQMPPYVARSFDPKTRAWMPDTQPYTMRLANDHAGNKALMRMRKRVEEGALWPADEASAKALGVPFVEVEQREGVWVAKGDGKTAKKAAEEKAKAEREAKLAAEKAAKEARAAGGGN